ncbi:MAG: Hsp20/alpha crystallin family protein [Patescibacteria group bacterium]|nr:Hsp20/alpha crystallin family protein [Patescibacteria group bacterium]
MVKKALSKLGRELSEEEFFLGSDIATGTNDWFTEGDTAGELAVDVYETAEDIVVKAPVAGVAPEDIDITAKPDMLTIAGERKEEKEVANESYVARECFWGSFSRSVSLPSEGEVDKAKVTFKDGILTVRIPKSKKHQSVKLKINQ